MAERKLRLPINAPGKYYVDCSCLDCDACRQIAPNNFIRDDRIGYSYVTRQPETPAEIAQVLEAVEGCPCESIGTDGDLGSEVYAGWEEILNPKPRPGSDAAPQPVGFMRKCGCKIRKLFPK